MCKCGLLHVEGYSLSVTHTTETFSRSNEKRMTDADLNNVFPRVKTPKKSLSYCQWSHNGQHRVTSPPIFCFVFCGLSIKKPAKPDNHFREWTCVSFIRDHDHSLTLTWLWFNWIFSPAHRSRALWIGFVFSTYLYFAPVQRSPHLSDRSTPPQHDAGATLLYRWDSIAQVMSFLQAWHGSRGPGTSLSVSSDQRIVSLGLRVRNFISHSLRRSFQSVWRLCHNVLIGGVLWWCLTFWIFVTVLSRQWLFKSWPII